MGIQWLVDFEDDGYEQPNGAVPEGPCHSPVERSPGCRTNTAWCTALLREHMNAEISQAVDQQARNLSWGWQISYCIRAMEAQVDKDSRKV